MTSENVVSKVILKSFLGTVKPKEKVVQKENYWKLIGEQGSIIKEDIDSKKVLVLFERDLDDFEVENHNPIKNSLWIRKSDLSYL